MSLITKNVLLKSVHTDQFNYTRKSENISFETPAGLLSDWPMGPPSSVHRDGLQGSSLK